MTLQLIPNNNTVNGYINNNNTTTRNTAGNHIAKHEIPTRNKKALYSSKVIESCNENVGKNVEGNTANFTMVKSKKEAVFGTKNSGTHTHKTLAENRIIRDFSIFVGGISNEVTADDLTEYIKQGEIYITPFQ